MVEVLPVFMWGELSHTVLNCTRVKYISVLYFLSKSTLYSSFSFPLKTDFCDYLGQGHC